MNFLVISKFLLYLAPFAVVMVTPSTLFPFIVGKYTFFKVVIELALIAFILAWGFQQNFKSQVSDFKSLLRQPLVLAVTAFVAIFTLAGFTGINPWASFWSNFERGEGVFLMLHFYVFFLLLLALFTKEVDWKNLFKVSIGAATMVILYGLFGAFGFSGFVGTPICERFSGSLGNPAYIGTFSIFLLFYIGYLLASGNWKGRNWQIWALPTLVFFALYFFFFLLLSQTRGGFLGLGVGMIVLLLYLAFVLPSGSWRKAAIGGAVALVLLGSLGVYYRQHINLAPWCGEGANRILDVSLSGATIGTRFTLWQQSIDAWKERPLLGWGPENFSIAFERHYNPVHTVWFDRAHNIFFDYLIFAGILGLTSFISIFLLFYWQFVLYRKKQKLENDHNRGKKLQGVQLTLQDALVFALPIAYLVQGLVLFDVLPIYINLFIFLAFVSYRLKV